jgi:hypothetical protein
VVRTGSIWFRIGTSGGRLWTLWWTFRLHKMLGSSWVVAQSAASQEGLSSMILAFFRYLYKTKPKITMDLDGNSTACVKYAYSTRYVQHQIMTREIWDFHSCKYSYFGFLRYVTMYYGSWMSRFRKNILLEVTTKMETEYFHETLISTYQFTWYHNTWDHSMNSSYVSMCWCWIAAISQVAQRCLVEKSGVPHSQLRNISSLTYHE